ncbi:hypothetical protein EDD11_009978 [Mortierella claussenii]|nr:hypothetical protein EDD11_009978 [Mortierella claussenii]
MYESAIQNYHATPSKQRTDGSREPCTVAHFVFDTKKEMCKAIYALSGTLNHAIALKESFIIEKTDIFIRTLRAWRGSGKTDVASIRSAFEKPRLETRRFSALMFPPVQFPQEKFEDIQVANLKQTLLRTINVDQRDFVFEICSIEVYLMYE